MVHAFGLGRSFMALAHARATDHVEEIQIAETPEVKPPKPVIDWAFDSTLTLLEKMGNRRKELEASIARQQEELRQVNVVLDGAGQMMQTIANGKTAVTDQLKEDIANDIMDGLANLK